MELSEGRFYKIRKRNHETYICNLCLWGFPLSGNLYPLFETAVGEDRDHSLHFHPQPVCEGNSKTISDSGLCTGRENGIQEDWNFAYEMAEGDYVTLAHQDDMYHKDYVKFLLQRAEQYPDMTVFTTDYATVKGNRLQSRKGLVEWVKVILRLPLTNPEWTDREWVKKAALIFGNPICCPSCAYHKKLLGEGPLFTSRFRYVLDWDTMWKLAGEKGRFVCEERPLIYYRVHDGATTKQWIDAGGRMEEEMAMFRKLWPEPAARLIEYFYRKAYKAYD